MKKLLVFFIISICNIGYAENKDLVSFQTQYPNPNCPYVLNPIANCEGKVDDTNDVMVPIPMKDRVFNKTGIQCVWCSLETCGRYADEPKLIGLTDLKECKSYARPIDVEIKLKQLKVKFEQSISKSDRKLLIKSVVIEKRGCLFAIEGHAMTLVHYDEKKGIVKYINNSDASLQIRTWSMNEFNNRWTGWICVIYADKEIIKNNLQATQEIPIVDKNAPQKTYSKEYIVLPK